MRRYATRLASLRFASLRFASLRFASLRFARYLQVVPTAFSLRLKDIALRTVDHHLDHFFILFIVSTESPQTSEYTLNTSALLVGIAESTELLTPVRRQRLLDLLRPCQMTEDIGAFDSVGTLD